MKALKYLDHKGKVQFINTNQILKIGEDVDESGRPYLRVTFINDGQTREQMAIHLHPRNKPEIVNHHDLDAFLYDWCESSE